MLVLYLFSLGLGGVLLAASLLGGSDVDDVTGNDLAGHAGDWQHIFSVRNATYFLFVFGAVGSLLTWFGGGGFGTALLAGVAALFMAVLVHLVFTYIRQTDTSEMMTDAELVGRDARVTLSIRPDSIGKIELVVEGKRVELLARPFQKEEVDSADIEHGTEVVIVEMAAGTALVSRVAAG